MLNENIIHNIECLIGHKIKNKSVSARDHSIAWGVTFDRDEKSEDC